MTSAPFKKILALVATLKLYEVNFNQTQQIDMLATNDLYGICHFKDFLDDPIPRHSMYGIFISTCGYVFYGRSR